MRTVIPSDLHLGAWSSCDSDFWGFLRSLLPDDRLVLNGDMLHSSGAGIRPVGYGVLRTLRDEAKRREVVWVKGNHDAFAIDVAALLRVPFVEKYEFEVNGFLVCVTHGHQDPINGEPWDKYLKGYPTETTYADWYEDQLSFWGGKYGRWVATKCHHMRKWMFDCKMNVRNGALKFATERKYDAIVCGHTHLPELPVVGQYEQYRPKMPPLLVPWSGHTSPTYVNSGSWCEGFNTYVTVDEHGVTLRRYPVDV